MPWRDAAGADMAAVYFAGHGMEISDENWLIPVDAELRGRLRSFIPNGAPLNQILAEKPPEEPASKQTF